MQEISTVLTIVLKLNLLILGCVWLLLGTTMQSPLYMGTPNVCDLYAPRIPAQSCCIMSHHWEHCTNKLMESGAG